MPQAVRFFTPLLILSILAGCTSDGYLGEIEDPAVSASGGTPAAVSPASPGGPGSTTPAASPTTPGVVAPATLWREAAVAHPGDLDATATSVMTGSPVEVPTSSAVLVADLTAPTDTFDGPAPTHLALWNVTRDGERGWLVIDASDRIEILGDLRVSGTFEADARGQRLQLAGNDYGLTAVALEPRECRFAWNATEEAACERWRALQPPAVPSAFANHTRGEIKGLELGTSVTVRAPDLTFFGRDASGTRVGGEAAVDTSGARVIALAILGDAWPFSSPRVAVPLDLDALPLQDNVTLRLSRPGGAVTFPTATRSLDGFREVIVGLREHATVSVSRADGGTWRLQADDASFTRVATDGTERLGATIRLAPDLLDVHAPAGNYTRLQLVLAETSQGASAELAGYRIDATVGARYVGYEAFTLTEDLLELLNETEGPVTPVMIVAVGVALPFVAILEGFAGFVNALFPPSLAGQLAAGEGRVLTFELQMPDAARDVDILIEARNAAPVRATLHLVPE